MSDSTTAAVKVPRVKPPIPQVAFVGYRAGELVYNLVETRPSATGDVLLDGKVWPHVRKVDATYESLQRQPSVVVEGELYAGATVNEALRLMVTESQARADKVNSHLRRIVEFQTAIDSNDEAMLKSARAV